MNNTSSFYGSKKGVAQYVEKMQQSLKPGSVLTTIISLGWLGGYFVTTVIDGSSEDIERLTGRSSLNEQVSTYKAPTPAG